MSQPPGPPDAPPPPTPPPSPPPAVGPAPGWYPDPSGRYQHRYWDGVRWTEHVASQGTPGIDPVAPAPPVPLVPLVRAAGAGIPVASPVTSPVTAPVTAPVAYGAPPPSVPITSATAPGQWGAPQRLRSVRGLATALQVVLWCTVAASVFGAIAHLNRIMVINDILDGIGVGEIDHLVDRANRADDLVSAASTVTALLSLTILVLVIIWMWRLAKNAEVQGRTRARLTPGWAIAGWLIPLANLVIPVLVAQDLWRANDPDRGPADWRAAKGSALIGWWWAAYIVASVRFFSWGGGDALSSASHLRDLRVSDSVRSIGMVVSIAAAILMIRVVRALTRRQQALTAAGAQT